MRRHVALRAAPLLAGLLVVLGCGPSNPNAPARVTGRVMYNGSPVTGGTLTFHTKEGGQIPLGIAADGTYSAVDVPEGDIVVTVETESLNPNRKMPEYKGGTGSGPAAMYGKGKFGPQGGGPSGSGAPGGKGAQLGPAPEGVNIATTYMKIPDKYAKPETSGLTVTLKKGEQVKDFELTD